MNYPSFEKKAIADKRYNPDKVFNYQCVDLILQYLRDVHSISSGVWGNAIDYWNKPTSKLLDYFSKVKGSAAKQGDIVVLHGNKGNVFGHIGVATGKINSKQVEILEQNGSTGSGDGQGGNAIRKRYVDRSRVAGLLRRKSTPKPPASKPKPAKPVNEHYPVVKDIPAYYTSADAKARKNRQGTVRKREYAIFNRADGMINVTTSPGHPGAWINPGDNKVSAPAPKPPTNTYRIKRNVKGYVNSVDAKNRKNAKVTVRPGNYHVFNKANGMVNVTSKKGTPGSWVNPSDNK